MLSRGPWPAGKPFGITVHHAADRDLEQVEAYGAEEKIGYHLIIDRDGLIHQTCFLDTQVAHAGNAKWKGLSPNRTHVAVSLLSWGRLTKKGDTFQAWSSAEVPNDSAIERPDFRGKLAFWDSATEKQEAALWKVLMKLCLEFSIDPANICGHDECALPKGRKDDPGGILSKTMPEVRAYIKAALDAFKQSGGVS
jgi:N-acetyl-anhydromuramyl-L-alanine amidase AmpD